MLLAVTIAILAIVGYITVTLITSSGSELSRNSIDDYILKKDVTVTPMTKSNKSYRYCNRYSEEEGRQLRIMYGTEYGAAEDIAKSLYRRVLVNKVDFSRFHPRLINCKSYAELDWKNEQLILFIISTSGDGCPPTDAIPFMEHMRCLTHGLEHLSFSVLALGDSNYTYFCKTGIQLDDRLLQSGAKKLVDRHNVDMEDQHTIDQWIEKVLAAIKDLDVDEMMDYLPKSLESHHTTTYHRNNPFMAAILKKEVLTQSSSKDDRQTVHIEFGLDGSSLVWQSGDALGVYPCNSRGEVMDLLSYANMSGEEMVMVDSNIVTDDLMPLLDALMKYYNLKDISLPLLRYFQSHINKQMSHGSGEVRDLFRMNPSIEIQPQQLVDLLKPLQPRYYSISSSCVVNRSVACITVVAVHYQILGIERTGVCSTYLYKRCSVGEKVGVFVSQNPDFRLPLDGGKDILMIGPGTGIAPFMSFIAERLFGEAKGKMVLYFGCRHRDKDFLYKQQLNKWKAEGAIRLHCAFSRDQADKIYVQHKMLKQSKEIYEHIQGGGHIYVCGDASHMAHDVNNTLAEIISREAGLSCNSSQQYLNDMAMDGRYQKDVWVT